MTRSRRRWARGLQYTATALVVALAAAFVLAGFLNSTRLESVTIRHVGPTEEASDKTVLGIGRKDALPDYRLRLHVAGRTVDCGSFHNTSAADAPLTFRVADDVPLRQVQSIVLIEQDTVEDDVLARAQAVGDQFEANGYQFTVASSRSFGVGLEWFFSTPIGKAISLGITIGIVLVIVGKMA